jgi:hypothetical protein
MKELEQEQELEKKGTYKLQIKTFSAETHEELDAKANEFLLGQPKVGSTAFDFTEGRLILLINYFVAL